MAIAVVWLAMIVVSVLYGSYTGQAAAVGQAAAEGATAAVELCVSICGMICLWSGVIKAMERAGLSDKLSKLLRPLLKRLFPQGSKDPEVMASLSENVSANLLGLGNAATPAGISAARGLARLSGGKNASDELCRLVVMNTASVQLIPTTIAAVRGAAGAQSAMDILPAVWISSLISVCVGLSCAKLMERTGPR